MAEGQLKRKLAWLGMLLCSAVIVVFYLYNGHPDSNIVTQVRLPRLILTLFTGMTLAGIGSVYQLMLANPLAEPYILGVSSGAAFGSIVCGLLGYLLLMPLGGFAGASLTMLIVWRLAQKRGRFDKSRLLIAGVITAMFFAAGISLVMYLNLKDTALILGTLMGNLGRIFSIGEWHGFLGLVALSLLILGYMYVKSPALEVLSCGDNYAGSLGIEVQALRRRIFVLSSLVIGISVAYAGIIGFVGLIIPHVVRFFIPAPQKQVYLASLWIGGVFLLLCDLLAKNIMAIELPVGVITSFLGCPFFMWLLLRK